MSKRGAAHIGSGSVVVVGGGISGLAAAYALQEQSAGPPVTLIEASSHLGGKIRTENVSGFVVEGGADSFLASKPEAMALCRELGLEDLLVEPNEDQRRTYVMKDRDLHRLPEGLTGLVPSRLEPLLRSELFSTAGKERLEREVCVPARRGDSDESLATFIGRRFGDEVYERMIEPLMAGIYAGDGSHLSLAATFPQLRRLELEHGSVMAGVSARPVPAMTPANGKPPSGFLTPRTGMIEIVRRVVDRLDSIQIVSGTRATGLKKTSRGYEMTLDNGEAISSARVILAVPAYAAAEIVSRMDSDLAALLSDIPYVSSATISLAYRQEDLARVPDGFGYVVPRREGRSVLACTWTSNKFPNRAPPGYFLARAFVGRAGCDDALNATDDELVEVARREMREIADIDSAPLLTRVYRWPKAMPQYILGHPGRLVGIESRIAEHPGLALAGHAYRGVGIPDCIRSGREAAESIMMSLDAQ